MDKIHFSGVMPALLTPIREDGTVNRGVARSLTEWLLGQGAMGFYVCGSTGEGPLMTVNARKEMLETVIETVNHRVPVIAHIGSINTAEGVELTKHATAAGADGVSSVPPNFYFTYGEEEIKDYYRRLAENTSLPFILYAVPQMANVDINGIVEDLLKVPNIVGLKDTRGKYYEMWKLRQLNGGNINIINGPDEMLICGLTMGADGGIGSTYNIMIKWYAELYRQFKAGNFAAAREMQNRINKVIKVLLAHNCLRALKSYLGAYGFDLGQCMFPRQAVGAEEAQQIKREIDALFTMEL